MFIDKQLMNRHKTLLRGAGMAVNGPIIEVTEPYHSCKRALVQPAGTTHYWGSFPRGLCVGRMV